MTQPPFPGNDFFGQIDSVARKLTGNAYRLKRDDPDAPGKFTEFIAQSEQEFGATRPIPQVAQPTQIAQPTRVFQDFEQGGFQQPGEMQFGVHRPESRYFQFRKEDRPESTNIIGQTIGKGIGPVAAELGRGTGAFGRWLGEAFEQQAYGSGGAGTELYAEHVGGKTPFDIAFKEARDSGMSMTDAFEAARGFDKQFDIGNEKTGYHGVSGFLRGVGDTLRGDLGITEPYVREGGTRRPMFTVGLADLASEVVNPMTILPGVGETRLITAPAKQIPKIVRGTRAGAGAALRQAGQSAEQAAEAIGRTGVGNVLDPVPPQTVAGRAAGEVVQPEPMRVFHGSEKVFDISDIESAAPRYPGGLGEGVYVAPDAETAGFYGRNVQETELRLKNPLKIDPENFDTYREPPELVDAIQRGEVDSVLIGEAMQPFDVRIGGKWHQVRDAESLEDIGALAREAGHDGVIATRLRGMDEILVLDKSALGTPTAAPRGAGGVAVEAFEEAGRAQARKLREGLDDLDYYGEGETIRLQWMKNAEGGQVLGNSEEIRPLTNEIFIKEIRPKLEDKTQTFQQFQAKTGVTHVSFLKRAEDASFKSGKIGKLDELLPDESTAMYVRRVDNFTSPEAKAFANTADSSVFPLEAQRATRQPITPARQADVAAGGAVPEGALPTRSAFDAPKGEKVTVYDSAGNPLEATVAYRSDANKRYVSVKLEGSDDWITLDDAVTDPNADLVDGRSFYAEDPTTPAYKALIDEKNQAKKIREKIGQEGYSDADSDFINKWWQRDSAAQEAGSAADVAPITRRAAAAEVAEEVTPVQRVAPTDPLAAARAAELDEVRRVSAAGGRLTPEQQALLREAEAPTAQADVAAGVTPDQQAIIDDVGTGARPIERAVADAQASRASGTAGGSGPPAIRNRPTADASFPEGSRAAVFQPASSVPWKDDPLIQRAVKVIRATKTLQPESAAALSRGRQRQIARGGQGARGAETFSEVGPAFKREIGGEIQRPEFEPITDLFSPEELNELRSRIWGRGSVLEFPDQTPGFTNWRQFNASEAFDRLFHPDSAVLPTPSEQALLERVFGPEFVRAVKSKKAGGQKAWDIAMDLWNLPRAMLATGDISATARQAGLLGPGNPKQFKDAFISQLKAFAHEEYALASREAIEASPNFLRFTTKTGEPIDAFSTANRRLHISQIGESAERGSREEIFLTSIAGRLPIMKNSERAFVTILNELRFSVMERMVDAAELANRSDAIAKGIPGSGTTPISAKSIALAREVGTHEDILNIVAHRLDIEKLPDGLTPQEHALEIANNVGGATDQQLDAIAAYINYTTGRGSLGKAEGAAPLLNGLLFSPRLAISRFQVPLSLLTRAPNVRKKIAMDLVKTAGGISLFLWLADNSPGGHIDVTANRFSSDFGKMRIGKTRFDFGAGTLQAIRFVSQIATGKRVATGTRSVSKTHPFNPEIASRYLRSKAHPSLGLGLDVANREDFLGEDFLLDAESFKDFDVTEGALRRNPLLRTFTFMWIQDVVEAWKESGPIVGALAIPLAIAGVGASSFSTSDDTSIELWGQPITDVWPFQQELAKDLLARTSDRGPSAFDQLDIDRYDALQDILVQLEERAIDKRTAVNRYFSINTFYSGLRKGLSAGIFGGNPNEEAVFPETPSGGTDAEKAALQEYYDSSAPFESPSGFNSDEWGKVLRVLERKWQTEDTLHYVLANTHNKPVPQELLDILPKKTRVAIKRSSDARAKFLKSEGQEEPDIEFGSPLTEQAPVPTSASATPIIGPTKPTWVGRQLGGQ